jgi:hypothetical protein
MATRRVFEIVKLSLEQDVCFVIGRLYEDLQVGESVFIARQDMSDDESLLEVKIVTIVAYRRELLELSAGMTGQLAITSSNLAALKNATHLLKLG